MTDKELIKQEIKRRIENILKEYQKSDNPQFTLIGKINSLEELLSFIDSLPEEPASEDFENIIDIVRDKNIMYASRKAGIESFAKTYSFNIESVLFNQLTLEQQKLWREEIENAAISGGEMGLELAGDNRYEEESTSEDLEREIGKYTTNNLLKKRNHSTGVYHLTQKDCDDITRHFAKWQKQQIMKDAVEGVSCTYSNQEGTFLHIKRGIGTKDGDKVKIIIVKEK